jgi:predicted ester cyclase
VLLYLEDFKQWVGEDLSAFLDMHVTILDDFGEQNKVAIRWNLRATDEKEFAGVPATHKKIEIVGTDVFHFEKDNCSARREKACFEFLFVRVMVLPIADPRYRLRKSLP